MKRRCIAFTFPLVATPQLKKTTNPADNLNTINCWIIEGKQFNNEAFTDYLAALAANHPIISIEDGLDESDWAGWKMLTDKIGDRIQLVGDDLFVTNTRILQEGINEAGGMSSWIAAATSYCRASIGSPCAVLASTVSSPAGGSESPIASN